MHRLLLMFALAGLLVPITGCEKTLPATVSGSVLIDGEAIEGNVAGEVMFHPSGGGAMAMASLKPDGTYAINTGTTKGLEPGSYLVTVRVVETEAEPPGGFQNAPGQKPLSPKRYNNRDKSGLTADVQPGKNTFDFDLGSK